MALVREKKYSVLEHIGRSVWGLRYSSESLFAMFTCYLDEAGGPDQGFMVVAGYVASVEQWEQFEADWKLFLISYKVPYFHMSRLAQFKSPYAKWENSPMFRARFLSDAAQIIQSRVKRGFSCFVRYEDFKNADDKYELQETY